MADNLDTTKRQQAAFVEAVQKTVKRAAGSSEDLARQLKDALEKNRLADRGVSIRVRSDDGDDGTLRVLEPTPSVVKAEVDPSLKAHSVEFYLTRPSNDGVVETRLLGIAKYPDSDKQWSVRFTTDRFGRKPQDAIVVHAEVLGLDGRLLAAGVLSVGA